MIDQTLSRSELIELATELRDRGSETEILETDCRLCQYSKRPWQWNADKGKYWSYCTFGQAIEEAGVALYNDIYLLQVKRDIAVAGRVVNWHNQPICCKHYVPFSNAAFDPTI